MTENQQDTTELDKVIAATNRYNRDLKKYVQGKSKRFAAFDLGNAFGELSKHLGDRNLYMRHGIIGKAQSGHSTKIELSSLQDLPLKLYQAPLIFKSKREDSVVVVIDAKDDIGNPVVVAINTRTQKLDGIVPADASAISSIHGRPPKQIELWQEQGAGVI